ncbi:hypothetical protein [Caulobacter sp. S45]|uniref:hypothetical protein n=1 Tax=Caulobacter sp. S45 TaxID=1641861 RepID=UPI00131B2340|nr:hypothetical protein [Caulobacter sp. S45]
MSRTRWAAAVALPVVLNFSSNAVSQPSPPPPPGFPAYVKLLDDAYNGRHLQAYGEIFRPDVKVYLADTLVSPDRASFLARIQKEFDSNIYLRTLSWAQGSQILVMEEMSGCIPVHPNPRTVYHGCHAARSIRYDLADDHKIEAVHILEADRAWNAHVGGE